MSLHIKNPFIKVICILLFVLKTLAFSPPEPELQEWEINPQIFSLWPKSGHEDLSDKPLKSPTVSNIHKFLPGTTRPKEYLLKIAMILESPIDEEELQAPGSVKILIQCIKPTNEIVLHANTNYITIVEDSVKVSEALLGKPTSRVIPVVNQTYEVDNDFFIIHLGSPCKKHKEYVVDIRFVAEIATDTLTGLYLSTYIDPLTNTTKRLATTQFEAEHARQMFPNYDDPDYKATFRIIVGRHSNHTSLSNMNLIKTEENKDRPSWYWDHYAPTPIMSSYLVAVIVSEFTCVPAPPSGYKKHVEVCGPPHMIAEGGGLHSAEVVATILRFYDDFMKQEYPLPKMTSVAIPDFQAGAMENWGLNTYRVKGLIYYPGITSEESRYRIDLTIAHELAHQNWGNLVTAKLWNQIWLNEGFATYISYYGLKSVSPEYDPDKQWMTGYRKRALQIDGSIDSHPLVNISSPMFYFDGISYSKGASLLRMMENFLTEKVFHEALRKYLVKHAYNTATQWDLFGVLESHALSNGVMPTVASFNEIMESWTLQPGYPLIRVQFVSNRAVLLSQERFIDKPLRGSETIPVTRWYVPISMMHDKSLMTVFDKNIPSIWLSGMEPSKIIYTDEDFRWIVINPDASVYGRILYDDKISKLIEDQLKIEHEVISAVTRAQIIEDSFETAWAGYGPVETALNFTGYLGKELESIVWNSALSGFGKIFIMFVDDEYVISHLKEYISERIASSLLAIGVEQDGQEKGMSVLHRGSLLHWAGILELPQALQHATNSIKSWVESSVNRIPSDLHSQTYCNAIIAGDRNTYDTLFNFLRQETDLDVKQALARSLGCSKSELILNELRQNLTRKDFVPAALGYELMLKLSRNSLTRKDLLMYLEDNFYAIQNRFDGVFVIVKSLETAAQYWNTDKQLEHVQDFIMKYRDDLEDFDKSLKRIQKQIQNNISWMDRFSDSIKKWLKTK